MRTMPGEGDDRTLAAPQRFGEEFPADGGGFREADHAARGFGDQIIGVHALKVFR